MSDKPVRCGLDLSAGYDKSVIIVMENSKIVAQFEGEYAVALAAAYARNRNNARRIVNLGERSNMKLRKNKQTYRLPNIGAIVDIRIVGKDYDVLLQRTNSVPRGEKILGLPTMYEINYRSRLITFWPAPPKAIEVKIRYYLQIQEI